MKALLQRKCAGGGGGCCTDCDREKLQRDTIGPAPQRVPPIVHEVLRSSGEPLDHATRAVLEPRFAHDFSRVRIHRDGRAAESAAAVGARAYTVGANVVLGRNVTSGVVAHELAHTIQQEGAVSAGELEIGRADDPLERDADGMAAGGRPANNSSDRVLRRAPAPGAEDKQAATVQHAGLELTKPELDKAATQVGGPKPASAKPDTSKPSAPSGDSAQTIQDPNSLESASGAYAGKSTFILHDTSSSVGAEGIKAQVKDSRGPLGKGVTAFVPRDDPATITRPFFQTYRPTATEFEKGLDALAEGANATASVDALKKERDKRFRNVWTLVDPKFHRLLISTTLGGFKLTPDEIKEEVEGVDKIKKGKKVHTPGALEQLDDPKGEEKIYTSATWAVEMVCLLTTFFPILWSTLAVEGKGNELNNACRALDKYFQRRNALVSTTNNVEIVAPGVTKDAGTHVNTCLPNDKRNAQFKSPPYSENQYSSVRALYLRAALRAKTFPSITTHKLADVRGHCDPRCFDLGHLYDEIAKSVGHAEKVSRYGVEPTYGTEEAKSIWWDWAPGKYSVCPEKPPK